jgi:tetratricopeptide (TPR) repeat protein
MNCRICARLFVMVAVILLVRPVLAEQAGSPQPPVQVITNAVIAGDWKLVRTEAIAWVSREPRAGIAIFLADVSTSVTHNFDEKFKTLMKYDYPYSDPNAREQVATWVESLLKLNDKNANVLILQAAVQVKVYENMAAATRLFEQARDLAPDNEYVLVNLGNGYGVNNRLKEAKDLFDKVLKNNPGSAGALNGLGMLAMSRQDMIEAMTMFEKAAKAEGAGPMEWFNLGSLYYYQKRLPEARKALEKAVDLSPKMIEARFNLAGTYYSLDRKQDCIEQLKKIVEIDPTSTTGTRARNNLRSLGGQ